MKFLILTFFCMTMFVPMVGAQIKTMRFDDELCSYEGTYNTKKYSEEQLEDTSRLFNQYFSLSYKDDLREFTDSYHENRKKLLELNIVNNRFFNLLKDSLLNYFDETYKLKSIQLNAHTNRTALLEYHQEDPVVKKYSEALVEGKEKLLDAYEFMTRQQMKSNGFPDRLWKEYLRDLEQPNKYALAFQKVLVYGWWNSVNQHVPHISYDGRQMQEFKKLFIKVATIDCDEP